MTHGFVALLLLLLLGRSFGGGGGGSPGILREQASKAQRKADDVKSSARRSAQAAATPKPWPQQVPVGMPPFPKGWQPDEPPPKAVQDRAWQLLPVLWKKGKGNRKVEKTQGRWITYQAEQMGPKRGVVAYRIRPEFMPTGSETAPTRSV